MSEYDHEELEFLDEDADIVQECIQNKPDVHAVGIEIPILLEKRSVKYTLGPQKRKPIEEYDSDYNPKEDLKLMYSPPKKRRKNDSKKNIKVSYNSEGSKPLKHNNSLDLMARRKIDVRIPNFEDPLCLPVKVLNFNERDRKNLLTWNKICFKNYKNCIATEKSDYFPIVKTKKTTVFKKNISSTGTTDVSLFTKIITEDSQKKKETQVITSIIPPYSELKSLDIKFDKNSLHQPSKSKEEVVLCKEVNGDKESLVVYKPKDALSLVYKLEIDGLSDEEPDSINEQENRKFLSEVACCRMCVLCFQTSYRGIGKTKKESFKCAVCSLKQISIYSYLTHLKMHSKADIRKRKKIISKDLSSILDYHYKCRVCQRKFETIKSLKGHLKSHQGKRQFRCEAGDHITT